MEVRYDGKIEDEDMGTGNWDSISSHSVLFFLVHVPTRLSVLKPKRRRGRKKEEFFLISYELHNYIVSVV